MINGTRFRTATYTGQQATLSSRIATLQGQIASQKRIAVASDDPMAAAQAARLRRSAAADRAAIANADRAGATAALADDALSQLASLIDRAAEIATFAANGSYSAADRASMTSELTGIADDVAAIAGRTDASGNPLFAPLSVSVPAGNGVSLAPAPSHDAVFSITGAAGATDLVALLRQAAADPSTALQSMRDAGDHLATVRGVHGIHAARIETARQQLSDRSDLSTGQADALEATDMAAAVAELQATQLALDATQSAFARVNRRTLFDLLG